MSQFVAFAGDVEVNGQTVLSVVEGLGTYKRRAYDVLAEHGIVDPAPGKWYSQDAWLNAFRFIGEKLGTSTLYSIGFKIPENADFPPQIETLGDALNSLDVAYHMNHRGGEIGFYKAERTGKREATMLCRNPYPCDFDRGIIVSLARLFKPYGHDHHATARHDDSQPCRKKGDDSCTYIVRW